LTPVEGMHTRITGASCREAAIGTKSLPMSEGEIGSDHLVGDVGRRAEEQRVAVLGGARAENSAARFEPAPDLFSITNCWPSSLPSPLPSTRGRDVGRRGPGMNPTMMRTGPVRIVVGTGGRREGGVRRDEEENEGGQKIWSWMCPESFSPLHPSPSSGRAGWGLSAAAKPVEAPHPTLPEDGEGKAYGPRSANAL